MSLSTCCHSFWCEPNLIKRHRAAISYSIIGLLTEMLEDLYFFTPVPLAGDNVSIAWKKGLLGGTGYLCSAIASGAIGVTWDYFREKGYSRRYYFAGALAVVAIAWTLEQLYYLYTTDTFVGKDIMPKAVYGVLYALLKAAFGAGIGSMVDYSRDMPAANQENSRTELLLNPLGS